MDRYSFSLAVLVLASTHGLVDGAAHLKSDKLCSQCSKCDTSKCPPSEAYPHMTAFDNSLIAGALQSDYVDSTDRGVYSVPDIKGGQSVEYNAYYGWESTSGSVSGHHRVSLRALSSLKSVAEADWKSINPPKNLNHREFRFWVSRSTGKCLTIYGGKKNKRTLAVADCKFNGSNTSQLFAFRFHYHNTFCCCNLHNE